MGNPNPNTSGLKPYSADNPPPGNGRPRGSRNRSTYAKKYLEAKMPGNVVDPFNAADDLENVTVAEAGTIKQVEKMLNGDTGSYEALMNAAYGKVPDLVISDPDQINEILDMDVDVEKATDTYKRILRDE